VEYEYRAAKKEKGGMGNGELLVVKEYSYVFSEPQRT